MRRLPQGNREETGRNRRRDHAGLAKRQYQGQRPRPELFGQQFGPRIEHRQRSG
jgi:hypothetical protein